jgi:hypothetical protein
MKAVPVTGVPMVPASHQAPRQPSGGTQKRVGGRSQREAARRGRGHKLPASLGCDGQRFFGENMLVRGKSLHRDVEMRGGNRQVQNQINVRISHECVDIHRAQAEFRSAPRHRICVGIGAGTDFNPAEHRDIAQVGH